MATNYELLGKKIILLASGHEPVPQNIRELKAFFAETHSDSSGNPIGDPNVDLSAYQDDDEVSVVQSGRASSVKETTKLVIKLPDRAELQAAIDSIEQQEIASAYILPNFYRELFPGPPRTNLTKAERRAVLEARIGDYSMASCK